MSASPCTRATATRADCTSVERPFHFLIIFSVVLRTRRGMMITGRHFLDLITRRGAMLRRFCVLVALAALVLALGQPFAPAAKDTNLTEGLKPATIELKSAGPLAFAPEGILLVGDPTAAAIYAVDTGDRTAASTTDRPKVEGVDEKIASLLGTEAKEVQVKDVAVNPISGNAYLSVARGRGPNAAAAILKVTRDNKLSELSLKDVKSAKATLPNPVGDGKGKAKGKGASRQDAITQIGYVNGKVLVAGLSNEEFSSNLRAIPFPFDKTDKGTSIEMYHGAHGAVETRSPIRVFAPYKIGAEDHSLAAYTCTPLVKIPIKKLEPGTKFVATTVAELGNRNRPLSIIVYKKGGKDYALIANSSRGMMKVNLEGVDKIEGITSRINGTAGLKYETLKELAGVEKLDAFDKDHALVLNKVEGKLNLGTVELP